MTDLSGPGDDCARAELLIAAGDSSPDETLDQAFLEAHLGRCPSCRRTALDPPASEELVLSRVPRQTYEFGVEIGRGGMGRVLAARDLRTGRPVAIKEMLGTSARAQERFRREAEVTARLQHPGIVPVYEVGRWSDDGGLFYAMRILPEGTLRSAVAGARNARERLALVPRVLAAAEAVAYAHSEGVIHRDLSPANILLGSFAETYVIDWGLAKVLDTEPAIETVEGGSPSFEGGLTVAGAIVGTPGYRAPELIGGRPADERTDVYALGAILENVLTGQSRTEGASTGTSTAEGPAPRASGATLEVPRDLLSVVRRATAPQPEGRYATAGALVEELRRQQIGQLVQAHPYSGRELLARWVSRRMSLVLVAAALLALLAVSAVVGVAKVALEREAANASARRAEETAATLLEEQGRQELLEGRSSRALALLTEAYLRGNQNGSLRFLLAAAARPTEALERTLSGPELPTDLRFSPDGKRLAVADGKQVALLPTSGADPALRLSPGEGIERILFSRDGSRLLTWGMTVAAIERQARAKLRSQQAEAWGSALDAPDVERWVPSWAPDARRRLGQVDKVIEKGSFGLSGIVTAKKPPARRVVSPTPQPWVAAANGTLRVFEGRLVPGQSDSFSLWDARTGRRLEALPPPPEPRPAIIRLRGEKGGISAAYAPGALTLRSLELDVTQAEFVAQAVRSVDVDAAGDLVTTGLEGVQRWTPGAGQPLILSQATGVATGRLVEAVFSPSGDRILARSVARDATLFDGEGGTPINYLGITDAFAFSTDGSLLATASYDGGIRLWLAETGQVIESLDAAADGRGHVVSQLAFSADGSRLASAATDGTIRLWDLGRIALVRRLVEAWTERVAICPSPTGRAEPTRSCIHRWDEAAEPAGLASAARTLLMLNSQGNLRVWDARGATSSPRPVDLSWGKPEAFSGDRGAVLLVDRPQALDLQLRSTETGAVWRTLHTPAPVAHAGLSPDASRILTTHRGGSATLWDGHTGQAISTLDRYKGVPVEAFAFSPDGRRIFVHGMDQEHSEVWSAQDGRFITALATGDPAVPVFSPDGRLLATLGERLEVWRVGDGHLLYRVRDADGESLPAFSPDSAYLAFVRIIRNRADQATVLDALSGQQLGTVAMPLAERVRFGPDSSLLLTIGDDSNMWDWRGQRLLARFGQVSAFGATQIDAERVRPPVDLEAGLLALALPSRGVQIWDVHLESRSPEEMARLRQQRVPWRFVGGQLVASQPPQ